MSGTSPIIRQIGFRARSDSVGLNTATWDKTAQNVDFSQNVDEVFRLRLLISDTVASTKSANRTFGLEFQIGGVGGFTAIGPTTAVQGSPSAFFTDDDLTTKLLTGGQNTFVQGRGDTDGTVPNAGNITLGAGNDHTEVESCLLIDSAQVSDGQTIVIRATGTDATPTQQPTITVVETAATLHDLTGSISASGTLSGTLEIVTPVQELSGSMAGTGSLTGDLEIRRVLFGSIAGTGSLAGTLTIVGTFDPADLAVNIAGTTAELTWSASGTPGVADYSVFRRTPQTGGAFDPEVDTPVATGITDLFYDDTGLAPGDFEWQVYGRIPV